MLVRLTHCGLVTPYISGSTLAQVMACCLTAPSHYLNHCWHFIKGVLWHQPELEWNFTRSTPKLSQKIFGDYMFKINGTSSRDQWVPMYHHLSSSKAIAESNVRYVMMGNLGIFCHVWGPATCSCPNHIGNWIQTLWNPSQFWSCRSSAFSSTRKYEDHFNLTFLIILGTTYFHLGVWI